MFSIKTKEGNVNVSSSFSKAGMTPTHIRGILPDVTVTVSRGNAVTYNVTYVCVLKDHIQILQPKGD